MNAHTLQADRVLAAPGHEAARGAMSIEIQNGVITAMAPRAGAPSQGLLAMPALANAHDHGRGLRSLAVGAVDGPLEPWIADLAAEPVVDPYLRAATAFARMVESGICAANHCHNTQSSSGLLQEAKGVAQAASDVGLRIAFSVPFHDRNPIVYGKLNALRARLSAEDGAMLPDPSNAANTFAERLALFDEIASLESPYFTVQYGPVGPQWITDDALRTIARHAAHTGRRVHMHFFETTAQRDWARLQYPQGYIKFLDEIGLLTDRLTLAHAVWLSEDEACLLAERGVIVSVNSSSNLRLQSGMAPTGMFARVGLRFGIGLDGMALDDDEDMLRELRLLRHIAQAIGTQQDRAAISDRLIWDAALRVGRQSILGHDHGGSLAVGAPADIVLLDVAAMTQDCIADDIDPLAVLLTRMSRRHVRDVMIAGRLVARDGKCCSVDLPALESELLAGARHARAAAPRNLPRAARLRAAIADYYACGCHLRQE